MLVCYDARGWMTPYYIHKARSYEEFDISPVSYIIHSRKYITQTNTPQDTCYVWSTIGTYIILDDMASMIATQTVLLGSSVVCKWRKGKSHRESVLGKFIG